MPKPAVKDTITTVSETENSDLENLIGYNLKRADVIAKSGFQQAMGDTGLSARVFTALSLMVTYPNIAQSSLSRIMGIERSGLVAIVDELEARGYLKRAPVPGDRRVQALIPTQAGQQAYDQALTRVQTQEARQFAELSAEEKQTLLGLLKRIRQMEPMT